MQNKKHAVKIILQFCFFIKRSESLRVHTKFQHIQSKSFRATLRKLKSSRDAIQSEFNSRRQKLSCV